MRKTLLAAALAALGLSGCNSLGGKTPQEMMQISMARSLKQDSSYNFSGEARVYLSNQEDGVAPGTAAKPALQTKEGDAAGNTTAAATHDADAAMSDEAARAAHQAAEDALYDYLGDGVADSLVSGNALMEGLGGKMADMMQEYPALANYLQNGRLKMSGAVDLREELMEFTPELVLAGRNEQLAVKMPLLFNGKDMSITADLPDSVPLILNFLVGSDMRERLIREPVRMAISEEDKKGMPVRNAVKAAVYAAYKAYGELPPEAFRFKEMDSFGKETGSRYRLELMMNSRITRAYYDAMLREFINKLDELEQSSPEAGATAEGYDRVREMSRSMVAMIKSSDADKIYGGPMFASFYLNGKGRLVGLRQYAQLNGSNNKALNIDGGVKLYNFGKPVFTFKPQAAKTIGFKELAAAIRKQTEARYQARYGGRYDASDDMADIPVPQEPDVIEEKVLSE
ncbi:MAG: hypothetical protein Q4G28_10120 [Neisseria sp.]|nr:hypothetical protein [Neisseria sp.]